MISYFIEIQFFNAAKTWNDAQKHCKGLGAELATVTTAEENSYLKQIIIDKYVEYYDFTDEKFKPNIMYSPVPNYRGSIKEEGWEAKMGILSNLTI